VGVRNRPTIDAKPFPFEFGIDHVALVCIDMQRDFCQPGGFAESLGNDIKNIAPCIPVIAQLQAAFRKAALPIIHTKECHKPDLSDVPKGQAQSRQPTAQDR
jgi:nicotinamidase-related amidase